MGHGQRYERVAVLGAGSWGTAVASISARMVPTALWARRPELAEAMAARRVNPDYLPDVQLPDQLSFTGSVAEALDGADLVIVAVPSHGFRRVVRDAAPHVGRTIPVLSLTKGLESDTLSRMTDIVADEMPGRPAGVLTGPNLAGEVVAGQPTASVVAVADEELASGIQRLLSTPTLRVYTNTDVVGCEMGGAVKNVMAIAAGMADGMGFGDNTRAALITRGLAELSRLGVAMGGHPLTFSGLAGMGDLIATCISPRSRNHQVGLRLGEGQRLDSILRDMKMVAEGVKTAPVVQALAARHGVEMPIVDQVCAVVSGAATAREAIPALMLRDQKPELYGMEKAEPRDGNPVVTG